VKPVRPALVAATVGALLLAGCGGGSKTGSARHEPRSTPATKPAKPAAPSPSSAALAAALVRADDLPAGFSPYEMNESSPLAVLSQLCLVKDAQARLTPTSERQAAFTATDSADFVVGAVLAYPSPDAATALVAAVRDSASCPEMVLRTDPGDVPEGFQAAPDMVSRFAPAHLPDLGDEAAGVEITVAPAAAPTTAVRTSSLVVTRRGPIVIAVGVDASGATIPGEIAISAATQALGRYDAAA